MSARVLIPVFCSVLLACGSPQAGSWDFTYPYKENGTAFLEQIAKRMVLVQTTSLTNGSRNVIGNGAGAVISSDGLLLTANHVVSAPRTELQVYRCGLNLDKTAAVCGNPVGARVIRRTDVLTDVALLKMNKMSKLPYFQMGRSRGLAPGTVLWRMGMDPIGWAAGPLLLQENETHHLEILMPTTYGASGGPVADSRGHLVGIVTSMPTAYEASKLLAYATPIDTIRRKLLRRTRNRN